MSFLNKRGCHGLDGLSSLEKAPRTRGGGRPSSEAPGLQAVLMYWDLRALTSFQMEVAKHSALKVVQRLPGCSAPQHVTSEIRAC